MKYCFGVDIGGTTVKMGIFEEEGKNIESVKALLGHEQSSTTELYVIRDENEDIEDLF